MTQPRLCRLGKSLSLLVSVDLLSNLALRETRAG